jgi:KDO2-lipid IV(A) lauroyltransferase
VSARADRRRYLIWKALGTVLEQMPVQFAVRIAEFFGGLVSAKPSGARTAVAENVRALLEQGTQTKVDERVLARFTRRAYASYARYWAEGATLPGAGLKVVHDRIVIVEGADHLDAAMATGRGVLVALPHVGSWEWGGAMLSRMGYPMTAVAEVLEPPELFSWFIGKREAIGLSIVPLDRDAGKAMLATLNAGGLVGLLADRDITGDGIEVELLGRKAKVPAGPATLALRSGAVLLCGIVYSGPGREHCVIMTPPIPTVREGRLRADVHRVTQLVADQLSVLIRQHPEQWHVFSDAFAPDEAR